MPCLVAVLALGAPRFVLLAVAIFSDYIGTAYDSALWPILGFFFAPLTTLAYAWSIHTYGGVEKLGLVAVIIAVLMDFGVVGGGARGRRRRRSMRG